MKINIISIGKIKEKFFIDAVHEYKKRISKYVKLNLIELNDVSYKVENEATIYKIKEEEATEILSKVKNEFLICMDIMGHELSTMEFFDLIKNKKINGVSEISFIIGGSYGLSDRIKNRSDYILSFSKMTFPHQLFRIILLEQIYRICKIENNEPYHK